MIVWTYSLYLAVSVLITVVVGNSLHRNGRYFVIECLHGNRPVADAVNHLLLAGYYLVNVAFVILNLRRIGRVGGLIAAIESLSTRIGIVCLTLGLLHFINLTALSVARRSRQLQRHLPEASPDQET